MVQIEVDGVEFRFADGWVVTKWDESSLYLTKIRKLNGTLDDRAEGTKAMDVVGVNGGVPYLFEVKDFRGVAIENKRRQLEELPLEIALKARDTIAGLAGLLSLDAGHPLADEWLAKVSVGVRVVVWLVEDVTRPGEPTNKRLARGTERYARLRQRLSWLTTRVKVEDPLRGSSVVGVTASSLPGAGPARVR